MARSPVQSLWAAVIAASIGVVCLAVMLGVEEHRHEPMMMPITTVLGIFSVCLAAGLMVAAIVAYRREVILKRALIVSREKFRFVAVFATDLVYSLRKGKVLRLDYISPQVGEMLGISIGRLQKEPSLVFDALDPEDRKAFQENPDRLWHSTELELRTRRMDGSTVWWSLRQQPIITSDGAIAGVEGVARDVTDLKRVEEALGERERQYRTLLGNLPGVAYRCKSASARQFEIASAGCLELFGNTADEMCASGAAGLAEFIHPDDRELVATEIERSMRTRARFTLTFRIIHRDGSMRWVWDRGIGVYGDDGVPRAVEGFLTDVTARKRADDERLRLLSEAQHALAAREGFLAMATHDLRSPLTALKLYVGTSLRMLQKKPDITVPDLVRVLDRVEAHVDRMQRFVDGLLDAARASAGRLEIELREVDLHRLVQEISRRLAPQLRHAGCELHVRGAAEVVGHWDGLRLEQVLTNLLSNAIKYGPGKPVELELEEDKGWATLTIRDRGVGLTPEGKQRLFRRFERLSAEHRVGSTGLGLWIARLIVEAHGGSISCDSDGPGKGTSFTIRLPLAGPSAHAPEMRAPEVTMQGAELPAS